MNGQGRWQGDSPVQMCRHDGHIFLLLNNHSRLGLRFHANHRSKVEYVSHREMHDRMRTTLISHFRRQYVIAVAKTINQYLPPLRSANGGFFVRFTGIIGTSPLSQKEST
jgi:hypothetical protein